MRESKIERERERDREGGGKESLGPNLEQPQGISFLQTGMEIEMGEVDLVFGFCVYYTKNPEQRRAQQLVINNLLSLIELNSS